MPPNDRHNRWTHAGPNNRHQQHTSCPLASALSPWAGFRPMDYSCSRHQRQRVPAGWIPPNDRHNTWTHADPNNRHQQHTSFPLCLVRFRKGPGRFQVDNGSENRSGPEPSTPTEKPDSPRNAGCQHNFQSFVSGSFMQWPCLNAGVISNLFWLNTSFCLEFRNVQFHHCHTLRASYFWKVSSAKPT